MPAVLALDPDDAGLDDPGEFPPWETVAEQVERLVVPGNHFEMLAAPHASALADLLRARLGVGRPAHPPLRPL